MAVKYDIILGEFRESDIYGYSYPVTAINANSLLKNIPLGYLLEGFMFLSKNANNVTINLGLTAGSDTIYPLLDVLGNQSTFLRLDYSSGNALAAFDVYISSALWGGAVLDVYLITTKIF